MNLFTISDPKFFITGKLWYLRKVLPPLHPAAFWMSLIDKPMLLAVDVEALQVKCAVNIVMSIPHMPKKSFTYQAIVSGLTCVKQIWYDKTYDKTSCCGVPFRFSRKRSVCDLYSMRQLIIQSFSLGLNDWKTKRGWCLPGLFVFWIVSMWKVYFPWAKTNQSTLRLLMVWLHYPLSRQSKVHNFLVRRSMDNRLFAGNESICWRMIFFRSDAPSQMMKHQYLLRQMGFPWQWRHRHQQCYVSTIRYLGLLPWRHALFYQNAP